MLDLPPDVIIEKLSPQIRMQTKVSSAVYMMVVLLRPALYMIIDANITPVSMDAITMIEYTGKEVGNISMWGRLFSIKKV